MCVRSLASKRGSESEKCTISVCGLKIIKSSTYRLHYAQGIRNFFEFASPRGNGEGERKISHLHAICGVVKNQISVKQ